MTDEYTEPSGPSVAELLAQLAERDARIAELSTRDPAADAAATVAVIEAQTEHDVAVIEAQAAAVVEVTEATTPEPEPEADPLGLDDDDDDQGDDEPVRPVQPETDHWYFRDRRRS